MTNSNYVAAALFVMLSIAGCEQRGFLVHHKLVVTGNEHSVPMYSDERSYLKVSRMEQEGGVEGMAGSIDKQLQAKAIDDQTQVTVLSSDGNGAPVEIVDGPMKGQAGFVAKQNLD